MCRRCARQAQSPLFAQGDETAGDNEQEKEGGEGHATMLPFAQRCSLALGQGDGGEKGGERKGEGGREPRAQEYRAVFRAGGRERDKRLDKRRRSRAKPAVRSHSIPRFPSGGRTQRAA